MDIYEIHFALKKEGRGGEYSYNHSRIIATPINEDPIIYLIKSFSLFSKEDIVIGEIRKITNPCIFYQGPYIEF